MQCAPEARQCGLSAPIQDEALQTMKRLPVFLFLLFHPLSVAAQDISIKMPAIDAGSWFAMQGPEGPSMHVFRGKKGANYIYDVVPGTDPNGDKAFRDFRDAKGNVRKRVLSDGRTVVYSPHNCQRTIGQCTFIESGSRIDGSRYKTNMVRVNTPKSKGFEFVQVAIAGNGTQIPVRSGVVKALDKKGMLISVTMKTPPGGKIRRYKKLKASWDTD